MLPKSFFILLRAAAAALALTNIAHGQKLHAYFPFIGRMALLDGTVEWAMQYTHGTFILVRNDHIGDLNYLCSGWQYIPIWISSCNGHSGIVAWWKEPEVGQKMKYAEQRAEQNATQMMAL